RPGIQPVIQRPSERSSRSYGLWFPVAFRPPAFASWAPCPAREFRPPYGRPTASPRIPARAIRTHDRVYTFHTRETRTGPGALYTPRTAVFAGHRRIRGRRLPPFNGRSLSPRQNHPTRDVFVTRHQQEFPV